MKMPIFFHGEIIGPRDAITFQENSVEELENAFKDSVDEYLAFCQELGRSPEKPLSDRLMLRLAPSLHARAAFEAKSSDVSLNSWISQTISQRLSNQAMRQL